MTAKSIPLALPQPRRRLEEKGRDPYDGLRLWSALTHGAGILLAVVGLVLLVVRSALAGDPFQVTCYAIYGASMVLLYTASTLYHSVRCGVKGRMALRKMDHTCICLLIAGTYTPICLTVLGGSLGLGLFIAIWTLAAAGIAMSLCWINAPRAITAALYLAMGWLALFAIKPIKVAFSPMCFFWLLAGAAFYSIGGILYAAKWPGRNRPHFGCHEIFHVFILLGSVAHWIMMWNL